MKYLVRLPVNSAGSELAGRIAFPFAQRFGAYAPCSHHALMPGHLRFWEVRNGDQNSDPFLVSTRWFLEDRLIQNYHELSIFSRNSGG